MAMTEGIIIPKEISTAKILSDMKKLSEEQLSLQQRAAKIQDRINKREEKGLEATETQINALYQLNDKYEESNRKLDDLVGGDPMFKAITKVFPERYAKQLQKTYTKYVIKGRYFAASLSVLKGIKEGIENSSWIKALLGFFSFLAIFDKNGQFFKSLLDMGVRLFSKFVTFIIPFLVELIQTIFKLIPVVVDSLVGIIPEIMKSISEALFKAGEKAGGFFGEMLKLLSWIAGNDTVIKVLQLLVSSLKIIIPLVIALFLGLKLVAAVMAVISAIGTVMTFLLSPFGLIILAITAIIGFGYLIYKYWDDIKAGAIVAFEYITNFFTKTIPEFFDKYVIQSFIKVGNFLLKVGRGIWNWMKKAGNSIFNFFDRLTDIILHPFESLKSFITALGLYISSVLNKIFHPTEKALSWKQASAIGDISTATGIDASRLANVVRGEGDLRLTQSEKAALPSEFSQAQLQRYLNELKGDEGSQVRALNNIEKAVMKLHQERSGSNINAVGEF